MRPLRAQGNVKNITEIYNNLPKQRPEIATLNNLYLR